MGKKVTTFVTIENPFCMKQLYTRLIKREACFFSLVLLLFFQVSLAQEQPGKDSRVILTMSPLALGDMFDGPSLRIGGEVKLHRNIALALEGGYYLQYLKSTKIDPHGFLLRPSIKRYLDKKNCTGKFIAIEYMYKNQGFDFRDSIVLDTDRFEKQYTMKRVIHSAVFKYGNLIPIGKKFLLEWHCGVGIRHIRSDSNLTAEEEDGILTGEAGDCPIQEDIIRLTGTRIFPDFRAGIKIGYKIH